MLLKDLPLPAERIATIENGLLKTFHTADITNVSLLSGGLSGSAVYKIELEGKAYTLKLNTVGIETVKTPKALEQAATAGIAPKLYYDNQIEGIIISDFVDNQPIRNVFEPDKLITELANTIKSIHAIETNGEGAHLFETLDGLIAGFKQAGKFSGSVFDECFQQYEILKAKFQLAAADLVFSHNDLNPNNILCDGNKLWIIDWDVAYPNNRYIDLANVANFFVHTPDQEKAFLKVYFGNDANDQQMARFFAMRQICRIVYAMLMFQIVAQSKPADYEHSQDMEGIDMPTFGALMGEGKVSLAEYDGQLMYGKALLNTAVAQMRTPRFAASLAIF